jgi:hypothetical protein
VRLRSLFGKLDDWLNPIVVKELRQAVRSRVVVSVLLLFLLLQVGLFGLFILQMETARGPNEAMFRAGREVFRVLQGILIGTCLLVPLYAGLRLGAECSDTNVDLLFISTLRPRSIVAGKLLSSLVLVLLVFSACTPFMTFSYLLRGLDIPTIGLVLYIDFMVVLWAIQAALFLAVIPVPLVVRGLFLLAGIGMLIGLFSGVLGTTSMLIETGLGTFPDPWLFWLGLLSTTLVEVGLAGLLFMWSVAILNPPSANRALPVRLYLLGFWLATLLVAIYWSNKLKSYGPLGSWVILNGLLFALQLFLSLNEREQWGPRVARTIPQPVWLRLPAFLLYSGSAGGVLFSVLMIELTFWGGGMLVLGQSTGWVDTETMAESLKLVLLIGLYVYCYGLSAVLVRIGLLRSQFRPINTWLLAVLLTGLGSILPYAVAYFFFPTTLHYQAERGVWSSTNPFASIDNAMSHRQRYRPLPEGGFRKPPAPSSGVDVFDAPCLPFLAGWAGVVTLLAVPWVVWQAGRFRPLARGPLPVIVVPEVEEPPRTVTPEMEAS